MVVRLPLLTLSEAPHQFSDNSRTFVTLSSVISVINTGIVHAGDTEARFFSWCCSKPRVAKTVQDKSFIQNYTRIEKCHNGVSNSRNVTSLWRLLTVR